MTSDDDNKTIYASHSSPVDTIARRRGTCPTTVCPRRLHFKSPNGAASLYLHTHTMRDRLRISQHETHPQTKTRTTHMADNNTYTYIVCIVHVNKHSNITAKQRLQTQSGWAEWKSRLILFTQNTRTQNHTTSTLLKH